MNNSNEYFATKRNLDRIPKYMLAGLVITLTVMVVLMPTFIKRLKGSIYNIKSTQIEGVVIESSKKVLLGDLANDTNKNGTSVFNRDNFVIKIKNDTDYEMTNISLQMDGKELSTSTDGIKCKQGFYSELSSKEAETIKCEGTLSDAAGYKDVTKKINVSYVVNGESGTEEVSIDFYHKVPELNITNSPIKNNSSLEYMYAYSGGTNEDFYVYFPVSSIYLDKSENLEELNIKPQYKSSFGRNVKVEHPQSSDTDSHFGGVQPRLYDYLSYTKAGSGSYYQLDAKGSFVELGHILKGTPTTVTNTPIKVYVPIRAHYIKSGFGGYDRTTNDTQYFSISDQPSIQLTIYDKSLLARKINEVQSKLDLYDDEVYDKEAGTNAINKALNTYLTREITQTEIDAAITELSTYSSSDYVPPKLYADYSNLDLLIKEAENISNVTVTGEHELYTTESWQNFQSILQEAKSINRYYRAAQQSSVTLMEEKLGNAMTVSDNGLVYNNGYYDSVVTALNTLKEKEICTSDSTLENIVLKENKIAFENKEYRLYTQSSYSSLEQVISNINTGLKANDQSLIEQIAADITNAYEALVFEEADYEELDSIINQIRSSSDYINDLYTSESKQAVETVIEEINNNRQLKINNQQILINYRNTLNDKISALEYKAAKGYDASDNYKADEGYKSVSEYKTLFQEEINKEDYDKLYNDEGKELLESYVSTFNNQSSDNMNIKINNQSKMDKFLKNIKDLFDSLRDYKNNASYKELDDALAGLDKTLYTNESWTAFETGEIYNEATGVKINRPYKYDEQDAVDDVVSRLNQAIEQLDYKPAEYNELDKVIDKINNNYKNDKDLYKNYDSIEEILQKVNKDYKIIDQQKVDDLVEELKEAIINLELKDASYDALKDAVSKLPKDYSNYDAELKKKIDNVLKKLSELPSDLKITKQDKIDDLVEEINNVLNDIKQSPKSSDVQKNIIENKEVVTNNTSGGNNVIKGNNTITDNKTNEDLNTEDGLKILKYIKVNGKKIDLNSEKLSRDVAYDVDYADVEVGLYSKDYSAKVYGGEKILLGDNLVRVIVTDKKGTVYEYDITINRKKTSSYLTKLKVKEAKLNFNKKTLRYNVKVKNKVKRLTISYELEDKNAKVKVVGNDNIKSGSEVKIIVTASNKDTKTYVLKVKKTKNYLPLIGIIIVICLIPIYIVKRRK